MTHQCSFSAWKCSPNFRQFLNQNRIGSTYFLMSVDLRCLSRNSLKYIEPSMNELRRAKDLEEALRMTDPLGVDHKGPTHLFASVFNSDGSINLSHPCVTVHKPNDTKEDAKRTVTDTDHPTRQDRRRQHRQRQRAARRAKSHPQSKAPRVETPPVSPESLDDLAGDDTSFVHVDEVSSGTHQGPGTL